MWLYKGSAVAIGVSDRVKWARLAKAQPAEAQDAYHVAEAAISHFLQELTMNDALTTDEFEALAEIGRGIKTKKVSPCVAKHAKHLFGLKYIAYARNGRVTITDKGRQALFVKFCIDGLRDIAADPLAMLNSEVHAFLEKKGHICPRAEGGFEVTQKGLESLADIDNIR
jgi:hypothetical protein